MKTIHLIALSLFLLPTACAHLPEIYSPADLPPAAPAACKRIFPQGRWQFVHRIEALPPDGSRHTLIGVIQLSSQNRTIHCVMMTVEGLVILEADYDGAAVHIQRAVPPMNRPGLADGMIRDLQLIFFAPHQPVRQAGVLKDGERIYRYALADGGTEDLLIRADGRWAVNRYNRRRQLTRTVRSDPKAPLSSFGFPTRLVLQAQGLLGYQMNMTLLQAQPLNDLNTNKG